MRLHTRRQEQYPGDIFAGGADAASLERDISRIERESSLLFSQRHLEYRESGITRRSRSPQSRAALLSSIFSPRLLRGFNCAYETRDKSRGDARRVESLLAPTDSPAEETPRLRNNLL